MRAAVLVLALLFCLPAFSCHLDGGAIVDAGSNRTLSFRTNPQTIVVGQHFSISLRVCENGIPVDAGIVEVDARMPAHGHGMNYRPSIASPTGANIRLADYCFICPGTGN